MYNMRVMVNNSPVHGREKLVVYYQKVYIIIMIII